MRFRLALLSVAATAILALAYLDRPGAARPVPTQPVVLQVGDTLRVQGTNVECAVAKRDGGTFVECLDTAKRAGTYGTLLSDQDVFVVRFKTPKVAKTVFEARQHDVKFTTCR
jgi:hypothetical protein